MSISTQINTKCITIISNFPDGDVAVNGQTVKALNLINALKSKGYYVTQVDYSKYKKHPIKTFYSFQKNVRKADVIIMLPDRGALSFLSKWCRFFKKQDAKIYYDVVGGWLPYFLKDKTKLIGRLQKFNGIWVENEDLKKELSLLGFKNLSVVKNFKIYDKPNLEKCSFESFLNKRGKFVFLSRIDTDKGIFETMNGIYQAYLDGYPVSLDIYGPIKANCYDQFYKLLGMYKDCINYQGTINQNIANEIVAKYYMQFFLTKLSTEGIPGSIIDSFSAGVPIIYAVWNPNFLMIQDKKTGLKTDISDAAIVETIKYAFDNPDEIYRMSTVCHIEFENNYNYLIELEIIEKELNS